MRQHPKADATKHSVAQPAQADKVKRNEANATAKKASAVAQTENTQVAHKSAYDAQIEARHAAKKAGSSRAVKTRDAALDKHVAGMKATEPTHKEIAKKATSASDIANLDNTHGSHQAAYDAHIAARHAAEKVGDAGAMKDHDAALDKHVAGMQAAEAAHKQAIKKWIQTGGEPPTMR